MPQPRTETKPPIQIVAIIDPGVEAKSQPAKIQIDGRFEDWQDVHSYSDPAGDTHDTRPRSKSAVPKSVRHPDVDLTEYKVAHDDEAIYFYARSEGSIGRTKPAANQRQKGRYYLNVMLDIDRNDHTGIRLNEAGYYPATEGYDMLAELEYVGGRLVSGRYSNYGISNQQMVNVARVEQSNREYLTNNNGPYPAGFLVFRPGNYRHRTSWVYHDNDTLTFIEDRSPRLGGVVTVEVSGDGHELEARFPYAGFLKDSAGKPILEVGSEVDISFTLEASGELAPQKEWASDTGSVIKNYKITPMPMPEPIEPVKAENQNETEAPAETTESPEIEEPEKLADESEATQEEPVESQE